MAAQATYTYPYLVKASPTSNQRMTGGVGDSAWLEDASQVYLAGAPIYRTGGQVAVAVAGSNKIAAQGISGFAREDASGVENTPVPVAFLEPGSIWAMNFKPSDGDSAAVTSALFDTFTNFDVYSPSTGVYYLVANNHSTDVAKPGGIIVGAVFASAGFPGAESVSGDLNALVLVQICSAGLGA